MRVYSHLEALALDWAKARLRRDEALLNVHHQEPISELIGSEQRAQIDLLSACIREFGEQQRRKEPHG